MKLLILFPNATDYATVSTAVPILGGIAKSRNWKIEYFETYKYKKYVDTKYKKDEAGGFKPGFDVAHETKDFEQIPIDLQKKITEFQPDILAITALSPEYDFLLTFFPQIIIPENTKVIIGGIQATLLPEKTISTKLFDMVAIGEGEETFNEILQRFEEKGDITNIRGTYFYDKKNNKIFKNEKRFLLPADKLWEIERDYSFYDDMNDDYFLRPFDGKKIRKTEIEISRGCPYHCTYCANSALKDFNKGLGRYVKTRPIESSIKQMKKLIDEFGINFFYFADECFLCHPITWIKEYMDQYKLEINLPYIFMSRAENVTEEKINLLMSYDIRFQISIGVESGSDEILKNVCERSCTNDHIIRAFEIINKYKIRSSAFFIVGFPFEKREDTWKTINLCKKIKPSVASVSIFQTYPGVELTRRCIEHGFIEENAHAGLLTSDSLLNMPKPYLSAKEIKNLWRTFMLYATLPDEYYKDIEKCENDFENNKDLYNKLLDIRWKEYDWAEKKGDLKIV